MILERDAVLKRQQEAEKQRLNQARYGESKKIFMEHRQKTADSVYQKPHEPKEPAKTSSLDTAFDALYETLFGNKNKQEK